MLRWRGGGKLQLRSKIVQQKEKASCVFLSRKSFYFSAQRVTYFAASWLCILSFSHLADTHFLCASLTLSTLRAASLPTFPSLQLCLLFIPGTTVINKPLGDHRVLGGSLNTATLFWGKANWWLWAPDVSFHLASKLRHLGPVLSGHTDTACVAIRPPSLPSPALLFWRPHVLLPYAI